eukprot:Hpha_TRINITY_DN25881_c0_g1::TRINITY_DN25881_c0_g1_i1::g.19844::m.19844/K06128/LYPLA1; lysophospholipase I
MSLRARILERHLLRCGHNSRTAAHAATRGQRAGYASSVASQGEAPPHMRLPSRRPGIPRNRVIFGHGLGDTPHGWADVCQHWQHELLNKNIDVEFILPQAPTQPVSLNFGMAMPSWYDIPAQHAGGGKSRLEMEAAGIDQAVSTYLALAGWRFGDDNTAETQRVVLAGFSQGAAVALYTSLTYAISRINSEARAPFELAGVLGMSGYLPAFNTLKAALGQRAGEGDAKALLAPHLPPRVMLCHGSQDPMVAYQNAGETKSVLEELYKGGGEAKGGENVVLKTYSMGHEACPEEVRDTLVWLEERFA